MHYLIDGYNFLFRIHQKQSSLEKKRNSLIELLDRELLFLKGRVDLIFDSAEQMRDAPQRVVLDNVDVIYAPKGLSADSYILELVEENKNPKNLTIVTSDNRLAKECRHARALTLSIEEFIAFVMKKHQPKKEEKTTFKETKRELERLRKIFEKRLESD